MHTTTSYHINSTSVMETEQLAIQIGKRLHGGELIVLISDLGGGKTAFVRGMAQGMGSADHVASPTFTLSRQYSALASGLTLYHFDFYRLSEPGLMTLELAEIIDDPRAVIAIEWGTIVDHVLPDEKLAVTMVRTGDTNRELTFNYPESLAYLLVGTTKEIPKEAAC